MKEKILHFRSKAHHIVYKIAERKAVLNQRRKILKDLFLDEKRVLLEVLNSSKKKSTKEVLKKLHEIDRPDGPLEKFLAYYFNKK